MRIPTICASSVILDTDRNARYLDTIAESTPRFAMLPELSRLDRILVHKHWDQLSKQFQGIEVKSIARDFLDAFASIPTHEPYHHISSQIRSYVLDISESGNEHTRHYFLKYVLILAILDAPDKISRADLPPSLFEVYPRHLSRIARELEDRAADFYSMTSDPFIKDLCLLTLRLLPGGGRLIEPDCGIPRRLLLQRNPARSIKAAANLIFGAHGFRPFLQLHTHTSDLIDFNPHGMQRTYVRVADMLRRDSHLLGVYTASWFNDPKVSTVSPRLSYLREQPMEGGAFLLRGIVDENSTAAALSRSPTRRRLYDERRYQPRIYYLVWPKQALLAWAQRLTK